jgi:putative tryptophan/tyrosine transport system substrate-binding protein
VTRRAFITLLGGAAAWPLAVRAQQSGMRRIGVLAGLAEHDEDTKSRLAKLREGLVALGWVEGENVRIDYRFAPGGAQVQTRAKELVALNPDVILTQATPATRAIQTETRTIPVVFVTVADPVGSGFVASLAQPGGNITGLLLFEASITGKWLSMLRDIAPRLSRVDLVINPRTAPYYDFFLKAGKAAAALLGIELEFASVDDAASIERTFQTLGQTEHGILLPPDTNSDLHRDLIVALAAQYRLPAVSSNRIFVSAGGLMCYSIDRADQFRAAASYLDRILRGAKPADLPVQLPTKYETVINLKTAKALGLAVPPVLLVAADEVIE